MNLFSLPLELLREVGRCLDFRDVVNLAASSPMLLTSVLGDDSICRDLVAQHIPGSREARLADQGQTSYRKALLHAFARREAFATAQPYVIGVLGQGSDFCYKNGTLCYLQANTIRVLDVHARAPTELVFDLERVFGAQPDDGQGHTKLLHFQDDVLSVLCTHATEPNRLAAFITKSQDRGPQERLLFCRDLLKNPSSATECVRQGSGYLIYGSYNDGIEADVYRWQFWAFDLKRDRTCELNLGGLAFSTCNINEDILFEVVGSHFYIATSQITQDHEGANPTSYFGGCRFNLDEQQPRAQYWKVWRRQHREGAIHDLWADLSLTQDERHHLLLLETRREWQPGNAMPTRTFYTQPLRFDDGDDRLGLQLSDDTHLIPAESEQVFVDGRSDQSPSSRASASKLSSDGMVDDGDDEPRYQQHHLPRYTHHEYPGTPDSTLEFSSTATKYRAYNATSQAFLDLVSLAATSSQPVIQQLCLRIGSCIPSSPLDERTGRLRLPALEESSGRAIRGSEERLVNRGVRLWPREKVPVEVEEMMRMTTTGARRRVKAMADERGVVFSGAAGLVLVSFDPAGRWEPQATETQAKQAEEKQPEAEDSEERGHKRNWVRVEEAAWIRENKLIRLR